LIARHLLGVHGEGKRLGCLLAINNFKFEDVNTYDLGIDDLYLPAFVEAGSNIHIVAEIQKYDDVADVLKLDPIFIQSR
jgi:hypothetical protein